MKITRKFLSATASLACFLLILTALLATLGMQLLGDLKTYVQVSLKNVEEATGYHITLDDIGWDIISGTGVKIDNLVLFDADKKTVLFECSKTHIRFEFLPLFKARLIVSRIILDEPHIRMYRDAAGAWMLPLLAPPAENSGDLRQIEAFSDFSVSLKRIYINGGSFHLDDRQRNMKLDLKDILLQIEREPRAASYKLKLAAREDQENGGLFAFEGVFQGFTAQGIPERLSGSGELKVTSAQVLRLVAYSSDTAPAALSSSRLNAQLTVTLEPDWHFSLAGSLDSDNLTLPLPGGKRLWLGKSNLEARAQVTSDLLLLDTFKLTLNDQACLSGTCSLTRMAHNAPYLDLNCSSNTIPAALIERLAKTVPEIPEPVRQIIANTSQGDIEITDAHILASLEQSGVRPPPNITAAVELRDMAIRILPQLPPVKISRAQLRLLEDESLQADVSAQWPGTDNHTLHASIESVFLKPRTTLEINSVLSATGAADILRSIAPDNVTDTLGFISGTITAKTLVSYTTQARITADIDLEHAAFLAAGTVEKPEGASLSLHLKTTLAPGSWDIALPASFTVSSGTAVKLDGTVTSLKPLAASGSYQGENFDLSAVAIPDIRGLLQISGFISGRGTWKFPAGDNFPVQGTCSLNGFSLVDTASGRQLIGGSLQGLFDNQIFKVLACRVAMGETNGSLTGELKTLLPARGKLFINADLFDIDDFVSVIDDFIAVSEQIKRRNPPAAPTTPQPKSPGMLLVTDLAIPLKIKHVNLWNWDLYNGASLWTFKNGVMNWNDITFTAGGGPISGAVMFDMSSLPVRTLRLSPSKSQSDFLFIVPALRKNRTITGTMDMSGYFTSTFSRKEELGRNMAGKFHVTVTDGKLQKLTVLSKIMELMNLGHFFSFMSKDLLSTGMPYDRITADFTIDHAVMKTDNLQLNGPAMNLSAVGTINMLNENLDLIIGAQILETFGKIVGAIPLAGSIVTGKNKTITFAYFKVAGSYQDASVMPMPVKSISAPLLKIMNSFLYFPKKLLNTVTEPDNASNAENQ